MKNEAVIELAKLNVDKETVEKLYDETYANLKAADIVENDEELHKLVYNNLIGRYFKKKALAEKGRGKEYDVVLICNGRITDFGSQKKCDDIINQYKNASQPEQTQMESEGTVKIDNGKIIPLSDKEWDKGEPIIPEENRQKPLYGFAKMELDGGLVRPVFTTINVPHNFIKTDFPVGTPIKLYGRKNGNKSTENHTIITLSKSMEPPFIAHGDMVDILDISKKLVPHMFVPVENFKAWCEKSGKDNAIIFVEGLLFTGESDKEVFVSDDANMEGNLIFAWSNAPANFIEGVRGTVCGDVYYSKKDNEWKLNINAIYVKGNGAIDPSKFQSVEKHVDQQAPPEEKEAPTPIPPEPTNDARESLDVEETPEPSKTVVTPPSEITTNDKAEAAASKKMAEVAPPKIEEPSTPAPSPGSEGW